MPAPRRRGNAGQVCKRIRAVGDPPSPTGHTRGPVSTRHAASSARRPGKSGLI